jgi:hypothetical protein
MSLTKSFLRTCLCFFMPLMFASEAGSRTGRVQLFRQLNAGQTITYLVRFRSEKNIKAESNVVSPMAPNAAQIDAHGLLSVEILEALRSGAKSSIHARAQFLTLDSGVWLKKPGDKKPNWDVRRIDPAGKIIDFTISPNGSLEKITGLDSLLPEQQQAWHEWAARFVLAWTLPADGVRVGEKWKSEEPEQSASGISDLVWLRESTYVKDESCQPSQLSLTGDVSPATSAADTCAVLLTTATLKQKSSPKNTTPEDFKLHELKTTGTAKGVNQIITHLSLSTGLVVRSTEEASQFLDVVVAKSDNSNRVHYNVDARSHSEILLLTETPLATPGK